MGGEKLKKGDERVEITIITKQDDFAEVTIERLDDGIEVTPEDMRLAKRAFRHAYRDYVKVRRKEVDEDRKEVKEKKKEEKEILSPHHQMLKEAIARGCTVELGLQEQSGVIVGWEPFTHRNGNIEDFNPERFRVDGKRVKIGDPIVKTEVVMGSGFVAAEGEEPKPFGEKGDGQEETTARQEASVLADTGDEMPKRAENIKGGEYDE